MFLPGCLAGPIDQPAWIGPRSLSAAEQTDANPESSTDFLIAQSREGVVLPQDDTGSREAPVRQNPNLGWETPGAFKGFPLNVDVEACMRDPATRESNGFMEYYEQPAGQCHNGKFLECCWEGLVRCFECELLTALGIITILSLDLLVCSPSANDQMYS